MQLIIMDSRLARSRAIHLTGGRLLAVFLAASLVLMCMAALLYHLVFLKGAREGWPVIGAVLRLVVQDEFAQRDRFVRQNIDAMARKLGEMQARMVELESLGERVSGLAGIELPRQSAAPGMGGALIASHSLSMEELDATLQQLDQLSGQRVDLLTVLESRLFDQHIHKHLVPTESPAPGRRVGSGFGWRIDPLVGKTALHAGLDFPAEAGADIVAAAAGVVVTQEYHAEFGNMVEIDHGNQIVSRYAHSSKVLVKRGDLVRRGQKIAEVGTTGRSTGPHLHFEVLVQGVPQDPQKFLTAGSQAARKLAAAPARPAGRQVAGR
ncbi:MAG: M23 family metallopeptidase [Burkholderiales bacterium]|nr:M23 family metallopeptidase [Burkholderiales bacterium]